MRGNVFFQIVRSRRHFWHLKVIPGFFGRWAKEIDSCYKKYGEGDFDKAPGCHESIVLLQKYNQRRNLNNAFVYGECEFSIADLKTLTKPDSAFTKRKALSAELPYQFEFFRRKIQKAVNYSRERNSQFYFQNAMLRFCNRKVDWKK